jgi:hypothetical protein
VPPTDTRELGFRIATLQSTGASYGVYRRLGFIEVVGYEIHVGGLPA